MVRRTPTFPGRKRNFPSLSGMRRNRAFSPVMFRVTAEMISPRSMYTDPEICSASTCRIPFFRFIASICHRSGRKIWLRLPLISESPVRASESGSWHQAGVWIAAQDLDKPFGWKDRDGKVQQEDVRFPQERLGKRLASVRRLDDLKPLLAKIP
ncbi:MAG: hypothetical protein H6Q82_1397 [Deltaproteobacteria bacterium]|nr:hypothetical protein [Deltaproteobacteria bacterium]